MSEIKSTGPTWVDGIGPPLEQIAEDCRDMLTHAEYAGDEGRNYQDMLALIDEVKRLRALIPAETPA